MRYCYLYKHPVTLSPPPQNISRSQCYPTSAHGRFRVLAKRGRGRMYKTVHFQCPGSLVEEVGLCYIGFGTISVLKYNIYLVENHTYLLLFISTVKASSSMIRSHISLFSRCPTFVPVLTYTCRRRTEQQLILWNMSYLAESRWRTVQNCPLSDFSLCSYKVMLVAKNESKRGRDIGVESSLKCPPPSPDRGHIAVKLGQR